MTLNIYFKFVLVILLTVVTTRSLAFNSDLKLSLKFEKTEYLIGEKITGKALLENFGTESWFGVERFSTPRGYLQIYIFNSEGRYLRYRAPGWGMKDGYFKVKQLPPDSEVTHDISILYNNYKSAQQNEIATYIVATEPEVIKVKAVFYDEGFKRKLESLPVEIIVKNPQDEAAKAWELLNTKENVYFMHAGRLQSPNYSLPADVFYKVINEYKNTIYAGQLKAALDKYFKHNVTRYPKASDKFDKVQSLKALISINKQGASSVVQVPKSSVDTFSSPPILDQAVKESDRLLANYGYWLLALLICCLIYFFVRSRK